MSYQVLARKWRPRLFAQVVGQEHVLRALINALDHNRLHHAYLFTGTRGVGKTTLGRIFAKSLNCEQGLGSTPCGVCSTCTAIDQGRYVDLLEVDAASRTKVDDTRELLDNVQYAPTQGRYKVYLIDEVHMLSAHSFNALLKTLEEPPAHVKFILATTDPQKLPVTVLSRCLQFSLRCIPETQIAAHLRYVLEQEGVSADEAALFALARAARGSMRDALSLLDQAIAHGGGEVKRDAVNQMLGTIDRAVVNKIAQALVARDGQGLLGLVEELAQQGVDFHEVLSELTQLLQRVAVQQVLPRPVLTPDDEALQTLATTLAADELQLYYQIALRAVEDLNLAIEPRSAFEMVLLRMLAFHPDFAPTVAEPRAAPVKSAAPVAAPKPQQVAPRQSAPPPRETVAERVAPALELNDQSWEQIARTLPLNGMARQLALNSAFRGRQGERVSLVVPQANQSLVVSARVQQLQDALIQYLGMPLKLDVKVENSAADTPARRQVERQSERLQAARSAIENDPAVRALQEAFGARLDPNSIEPVE